MEHSIVHPNAKIGKDVKIHPFCYIAENVEIGNNVVLGIGDDVPNKLKPKIYSFGLVTIGDRSVIPDNVKIGKNTAISGVTEPSDYPNGILESGETIMKAGDRR